MDDMAGPMTDNTDETGTPKSDFASPGAETSLCAEPTPDPASRALSTLAGILASGLALAIGELFSGIFDSVRSLVVSVAEAIVDWTPGSIARFSIDLFGTNQKAILVWGVAIVTLLLGAVVGRLAGRSRGVALTVFAVFGLFGGFAAARVPGNSAGLSWVSALTAGAVGLGALLLMLARLDARPGATHSSVASVSDAQAQDLLQQGGRRRFLGIAGLTGAGALGSWLGGSVLRKRFNVNAAREDAAVAIANRSEAAIATPTPPPSPTSSVPVASTLTRLDSVVEGITPLIVPNNDFYRIDTALIVPQIDPIGWSMEIKGMVDTPVTYTYQDLLDRASQEEPVTLSCVSNQVGGGLVGNAVWLGVPLKELLEEAGVQPGATQLVSRSEDGWGCGFPTEILDDPDRVAMVAIAMNGEPLPTAHGFPARLVVSGLYGYVSATKWLREIEMTTWEDYDGYWIPRGWSKLGPVKTQSRIDVPRNGTQLEAGPQVIAGVAWAPNSGIEKVEVAVDDGEWQLAELIIDQSVHAWRQWKLNWNPETSGQYRIKVRATDGSGYTQTEERTAVAPDGATGHHTIDVRVA